MKGEITRKKEEEKDNKRKKKSLKYRYKTYFSTRKSTPELESESSEELSQIGRNLLQRLQEEKEASGQPVREIEGWLGLLMEL